MSSGNEVTETVRTLCRVAVPLLEAVPNRNAPSSACSNLPPKVLSLPPASVTALFGSTSDMVLVGDLLLFRPAAAAMDSLAEAKDACPIAEHDSSCTRRAPINPLAVNKRRLTMP
mmetsp:Transcript_19581/g.48910  ORF Transcript_19581/g.48910 Transcript_19581/m.48910 type:complete len:115 (-) Transcript_19581:485-829(-)